jgi:hypothetical protein
MSKDLTRLENHLQDKSGLSTSLSLRARVEEVDRKGKNNILLLDTSGSMCENIKGGWRKIDALWQIVQDLRSQGIVFRTAHFNDSCEWSDDTTCPQPSGGTWFVKALQFVIQNANPLQITIITDGAPTDHRSAIDFASHFSCKVNCMFVGRSNDFIGQEFCRKISCLTGGSYAYNSMSTEVLQIEATQTVKGLIAAPQSQEKKTIQL